MKRIDCEEALRHLFAYLDRQLSAGKRQEVEHHLSICRGCFSRAEFEKRLKERLREVGRELVRPGFEKRIKALIKEFSSGGVSSE